MPEEKTKKGLGRGLMSLFGDQEVETPIKQNVKIYEATCTS